MKKLMSVLTWMVSMSLLAQRPFPDYSLVHKNYYAKYSTTLKGEYGYVDFAKKPEGWFVKFQSGIDEPKVEYIPFWTAKTNTWATLAFDKTTTSYQPIKDYRIPYMYRVSPYFGYPGWYKDVIALLEPKTQLSDTLLYALNKAYFSKLSAAFGDQYGDGLPEDILGDSIVPMAFSEGDLTEIKNRHLKVAEVTRRMLAQNPKFETFIGSLKMQYANDVMDIFMRLYLYQSPEVANTFLETGLYDAYVLDYAKYNLMMCPPNAILFTSGDNDTYPLWYIQYALGVRTDVAVVNLSLLNLPAYQKMIRKTGLVDFKTKETTLSLKNFGYAYVGDKNLKMGAEELNIFLASDFSGKEPKTINGGNFYFKFANNHEYHIQYSSYLFSGDLLMLDIMYTNLGKRPLCFTSNPSKYDDLFEPGLNFTCVKEVGQTGSEHAGVLATAWNTTFTLSDYAGFTDHFSENHHRLVNAMVIDMAIKVKFLILEDKKEAARNILVEINKRFPAGVVNRSTGWVYVAANLGALGEKLLATHIMDDVMAQEQKEMLADKENDGSRLELLKNIKESVVNGAYNNF
jgi:hypothetical protein